MRNEPGDWFEPPVPVAMTCSLFRTVRPAWGGSVRIVDAGFGDELRGRLECDGAVEGYAAVIGVWAADHLQVERQDVYAPQHPKIPNWTMPPCPPPQEGWPHQRWVYGIQDVQAGERPAAQYVGLDYDLGDLRETGAAVAVTTFRPSEDQAVLVVAAADPEAVESYLRPRLGELLCVVPSKWTMAQLEAVRTHLRMAPSVAPGNARLYGGPMTSVKQFQVTFDCAEPERVARFWCEVLGYVVPPPPKGFATWDDFGRSLPPEDQGSWFACVDPSGVGPRLFFQRVPEGKVVKNRLHLDVRAGTGLTGEARLAVLEAECARLVALGAVRVRLLPADDDNESCIVMQDIEGNEFCLD